MFSLPGYRIERELARGGMGVIYLAEHETLNRAVAIKVLSDALGHDSTFADRFVREARMVASLHHPTICSIFDAGVADDAPYMVMEYLEGGTLADRLAGGSLSTGQALSIARQISESLQVAHEKGFVHRDIKPANIMFRADESVVLTDFGISKSIEEEGTSLTVSGTMVGTPHYISPEQAKGQQVDHRSDIYSLGVVLYEMLTGNKAYDGDSAVSVAVKHISEPVPQLPANLNHLQSLLDRMMAKDVQERIADCRSLSREIASRESSSDFADESTLVRPVDTGREQGEKERRSGASGKPVIGGIALVAVVVALSFGYFAITDSRVPRLQTEPELESAGAPVTEEMTEEVRQNQPQDEQKSQPEKLELSQMSPQDDSEAGEQSFRDELAQLQEANRELRAGLESLQTAATAQQEDTPSQPLEVAEQPVETLMTYALVVQTLDMKNCKGITGRILSRFGAKDEPAVALNGTTIWPESPKSLKCPGEHAVEKSIQLTGVSDNVLTVYETDERGANPVVMGMVTEPVARAREEGCLVDAGTADNVCTTEFNAHDGQYVLIWRVEVTTS